MLLRVIRKQLSQAIEKLENLLLIGKHKKQLTNNSILEAAICEKMKMPHTTFLNDNPGTSAESECSKASRGWFNKFKKRSAYL